MKLVCHIHCGINHFKLSTADQFMKTNIVITLIRYVNPKDRDDFLYNAQVTFMTGDDHYQEKTFVMQSAIYDTNKLNACYSCARLALSLFGAVSTLAYVFDEEMNLIEDLFISNDQLKVVNT